MSMHPLTRRRPLNIRTGTRGEQGTYLYPQVLPRNKQFSSLFRQELNTTRPTFSLFVVSLAHAPREQQNIVPSLQQAVHVPRGYRHSSELVHSGSKLGRRVGGDLI